MGSSVTLPDPNDGRTHSEECYKFGPSHYECAVEEIARLKERLAAADRKMIQSVELADQRLVEMEAARKDAERMNWIRSLPNHVVTISDRDDREKKLMCYVAKYVDEGLENAKMWRAIALANEQGSKT